MLRPDRPFGEHSDDAIHLSAQGNSAPAIGPYAERGGVSERQHRAFVTLARIEGDWARDLLAEIRNEQRRIARKRRWRWVGRTAIATGWLVVLGALIAYIIATLVIGA